MEAFELGDLEKQRSDLGKLYLEFLRVPSLSMGLYVLAAGANDPQQPHTEDEVYYIAEGEGSISVAGEDRPVREGSVVFVAANVPHHFHSITKELKVLVFFAPAEYSRA
jgi:quercetin dioxygenase-like cupin family protein